MKKLFWPLLLVAAFWCCAPAQAQNPHTRSIVWGSALPATCQPTNNNVFFKVTAGVGALYECTAINTWTLVGSGGGGGNCPATGTANEIQTYSDSTHCASSTATADSSGNIASTSLATGTSPPSVTAGTGGVTAGKEGTAPSVGPAAGVDICYADSTLHTFLCSYNNSAYFPTTLTIASGAQALATGAIGAAVTGVQTCASATSVSATGVTTADVIIATPTTDPTAATGYKEGIVVYAYPTADHVNFKQCNTSGGSLTPAALTLNWHVARAL